MKKSFFLLFAVLLTACVYVSCTKDDEASDGSSIIGKWQLMSVTHKEDYEPCQFKGYTEFKKGGAWVWETGCDSGTGTWSKDGNSLTMTADALPIPIKVKIITLDETTLVIDQSLGSFKNQETYKRIK